MLTLMLHSPVFAQEEVCPDGDGACSIEVNDRLTDEEYEILQQSINRPDCEIVCMAYTNDGVLCEQCRRTGCELTCIGAVPDVVVGGGGTCQETTAIGVFGLLLTGGTLRRRRVREAARTADERRKSPT